MRVKAEFSNEWIATANGKMRVLVSQSKSDDDFDLVLVHGLIVSSTFMAPTGRFLARKHRVVIPDLIGHGKSETPPAPVAIKPHAENLAYALDKMKVRKPLIVGGSYGCHVGLELSSLIDVKGLVFVGPTSGFRLGQSLWNLSADALIEPLDLVSNVIGEIYRIGFDRVANLLDDLVAYPFHERLSQINAPVLVITGERDTFSSPLFRKRMAASIASGRSEVLPGLAHGLPYTHPELIGIMVEEFINEMDQGQLARAA